MQNRILGIPSSAEVAPQLALKPGSCAMSRWLGTLEASAVPRGIRAFGLCYPHSSTDAPVSAREHSVGEARWR